MILNILIVDDEPLACEILQTYLQQLPDVCIIATCHNALDAYNILATQTADLMLLDINMPGLCGIGLLRALPHPPLVIFTTAYADYAVQSYEYNAIDYLLKPIPFERFLIAIQKVRAALAGKSDSQHHDSAARTAATLPAANVIGNTMNTTPLFVRSSGKLLRLTLSSLWLVEGLKDYLRLHVEGGAPVVIHATMKSMEDQLAPYAGFIRVSKSAIINIAHIREIDGNSIRIHDQLITIGATYRQAVFEVLDGYKL